MSQRYALARFTNAVQSRSLAPNFTLPIKFNGMAFTMQRPWSERTHGVNESKCHAHALGCVEVRHLRGTGSCDHGGERAETEQNPRRKVW